MLNATSFFLGSWRFFSPPLISFFTRVGVSMIMFFIEKNQLWTLNSCHLYTSLMLLIETIAVINDDWNGPIDGRTALFNCFLFFTCALTKDGCWKKKYWKYLTKEGSFFLQLVFFTVNIFYNWHFYFYHFLQLAFLLLAFFMIVIFHIFHFLLGYHKILT